MPHENKPGDGECFDCLHYAVDGCDWVGWPNFRCAKYEYDTSPDVVITEEKMAADLKGGI